MKTAYSYIRFSTPEQARGDSLRRQLEASREYAAANRFVLDESFNLRDLGVSAFRGKNRTIGALKKFLDAVLAGKIAKGSALIVESYDRISRQKFSVSTRLVRDIVDAGVEVHSISEHHVLKPNYQLRDTLALDISLERANEESQRKSERVGKAWTNLKLNASAGKAITARVPAWLRVTKDRKIELIPERAEVVRLIFELSSQGIGKYRLARELSARGIPVFDRGKAWQSSYVTKILNNRATIGEYQPYKRNPETGKREPDGQTIPEYYPPAVSHSVWEAARTAIARKRKNELPVGVGRVSDRITTLFSGLIFDVSNNAPMTYHYKGRGTHDWQYLVTSYRAGQTANRMRYDVFEHAFLEFLADLDWHAISGEGEPEELRASVAKLTSLQEEQSKLKALIARYVRMLEDLTTEPPANLLTSLSKAEAREKKLIAQRAKLEAAIAKLRSSVAKLSDVKLLQESIRKSQDYTMRLRLREEIRRRVSRIDLHFGQDGFKAVADVKFVNGAIRGLIFTQDDKTMVIRAEGTF
jgi:DNA invertase Pin-like site-specific DNA recombinase